MHRPSTRRESFAIVSLLASLGRLGCSGGSPPQPAGGTIQVGAILPFTGKEAALGRNIELAMLLAVEDVNDAGGISGTPLEVVSRDSNSGSERGLNALLDLLYNEQVQYLVGPEETELANAIVSDVKKLNITNVLPGYAAPSVQRARPTRGCWWADASVLANGAQYDSRAYATLDLFLTTRDLYLIPGHESVIALRVYNLFGATGPDPGFSAFEYPLPPREVMLELRHTY